MVDCMECTNFIECHYSGQLTGRLTSCPDFKQKPKTNADRIRAMTDEELMQLLFTKISCGNICSFCVPTMRTERKCDGHCKNGVLEWLQQPAEGDA